VRHIEMWMLTFRRRQAALAKSASNAFSVGKRSCFALAACEVFWLKSRLTPPCHRSMCARFTVFTTRVIPQFWLRSSHSRGSSSTVCALSMYGRDCLPSKQRVQTPNLRFTAFDSSVFPESDDTSDHSALAKVTSCPKLEINKKRHPELRFQ